MTNIKSKISEIYSIEQLAQGTTVISNRHPFVKLISTVVFIVLVVSFDRFALRRLIPFIFYPVILMAISETPWPVVLRRVALALPFVLLAGISNIIFDRTIVLTLGGIAVSSGAVSFFVLVYRSFLCVTAVLILVAVTPFSQLTQQLRRLRVPDIFVSLFEMIYRYIGVLLEEASCMYTAYMLRSTKHRGLQMKHMGSFVGQLLIRSFDRAERIYNAMKCRGYNGGFRMKKSRPLEAADYLYLMLACAPFMLLRIFDVTILFERLF